MVLGAGRVGAAIAVDLAADPRLSVSAVDRSPEALEPLRTLGIAVRPADLADPRSIGELVSGQDLVVGAVPGALGFDTARGVLEAGRDLVDISFFPQDPFRLDALARSRGCMAVVDAGVAPGLSNLVLGHTMTLLDETESFCCLVGGLPAEPVGPWAYRAPFSPADVIEGYIRPARLRVNGAEITRPALSDLETVDLPGVGELEAFLTDGLRTLLGTTAVPSMVEKTLRYPGHALLVGALRETGFFDDEPFRLGEAWVSPREVSARLLEQAWRFAEHERDLTVMRIEIVGRRGDRGVRYTYDLLDRFDADTATSSMARTTGYTCTALVRWLVVTSRRRVGVTPPETLAAEPGCFDSVRADLGERRVVLRHGTEELD